jgi:Ca2+/Na+ antiporter
MTDTLPLNLEAMSQLCQIGQACMKGEEVYYPGSSFFIDPEGMSSCQLFFAFCVYGYVLSFSANMIGDGAELLLLVPQYAGMVGSIVLPVLGAIPDGMMVLFSGVGPIEVAQENVAVGVGALAGSTIMLLTLPWILSVYAGQVDMDSNGKCIGYKASAGKKKQTQQTGCCFDEGVTKNAILMALTSLSYFVIQIPAFLVDDQKTKSQYPSEKAYIAEVEKESTFEHTYAVTGIAVTMFFFFFYLYLQYLAATPTARKPDFLKALLPPAKEGVNLDMIKKNGAVSLIKHYRDNFKQSGHFLGEKEQAVGVAYADAFIAGEKKRLPADINGALKGLYGEYAKKTSSPGLHGDDMRVLLGVLGLNFKPETFNRIFTKADKDNSKYLDQGEFLDLFYTLMTGKEPLPFEDDAPKSPVAAQTNAGGDGDDDDEEEDEMPEEFKDLPEEEQRKRIIQSSIKQMTIGTILVLIFTDPMVDVLSAMGTASGVPVFYISFILAPMASNASELVASYKLAARKTSTAITQSLQTLEGAACMNNTFCLAIFYVLIYYQGLAWKFTAETLTIFFVQILIFGIVIKSNTQTMKDGLIIFLCYPVSLVFVYVLEAMGWD